VAILFYKVMDQCDSKYRGLFKRYGRASNCREIERDEKRVCTRQILSVFDLLRNQKLRKVFQFMDMKFHRALHESVSRRRVYVKQKVSIADPRSVTDCYDKPWNLLSNEQWGRRLLTQANRDRS
jgi:hypothetical protein